MRSSPPTGGRYDSIDRSRRNGGRLFRAVCLRNACSFLGPHHLKCDGGFTRAYSRTTLSGLVPLCAKAASEPIIIVEATSVTCRGLMRVTPLISRREVYVPSPRRLVINCDCSSRRIAACNAPVIAQGAPSPLLTSWNASVASRSAVERHAEGIHAQWTDGRGIATFRALGASQFANYKSSRES
jgi:hypothetical protein